MDELSRFGASNSIRCQSSVKLSPPSDSFMRDRVVKRHVSASFPDKVMSLKATAFSIASLIGSDVTEGPEVKKRCVVDDVKGDSSDGKRDRCQTSLESVETSMVETRHAPEGEHYKASKPNASSFVVYCFFLNRQSSVFKNGVL